MKRVSANSNPQKIQIFREIEKILIGTSSRVPVENPTFKKLLSIEMRKQNIPKTDMAMGNQQNKALEIF